MKDHQRRGSPLLPNPGSKGPSPQSRELTQRMQQAPRGGSLLRKTQGKGR